ncbi:MAG: NfeD family protein [Phycisphaerales bacterium]|jgi:membrane-bound serine protease (ClpP class)
MTEAATSGPLIAALILGAAAIGIFFLEFVIPSGGLLAALCVLSAIASVVMGFLHSATLGMSLLALYSIASPFMVVFGLRMATRTPIGRRMVLSAEVPARTGASIDDARPELPPIGATGTAITPLRPSGFVRIDGRRLDASAEGDLIDAGTEIEVVSTRDGHLRVRTRRD